MEQILISEHPSRPEGIKFTTMCCSGCGTEIELEREYWKSEDGQYWVLESEEHASYEERCSECLDYKLKTEARARELTSDCAPSWFDPAYAGEVWSEEDY